MNANQPRWIYLPSLQAWIDLFRFASDEEPKVRLSFVRASEKIATNTPDGKVCHALPFFIE